MRTTIATCLITSCLFPIVEAAQDVVRMGPDRPLNRRYVGGKIHVDGRIFDNWNSLRLHLDRTDSQSTCGNQRAGRIQNPAPAGLGSDGGPMDCAGGLTNPDPMYAPEVGPILNIDVVFHIIRTPEGLGHIDVDDVQYTLQRLNEEFSAIPDTLGEENIDSGIRFRLADTDPDGEPAFGINYYDNAEWFQDPGWSAEKTSYTDLIAWDPNRYLNIYTNDCGYALGYAIIPQYEPGPDVGSSGDRIVLRWDVLGVNPPVGEPYELNRVLVHEVGHWCGLWHVFENINSGGCDGDCYSTGDTICDTAKQYGPYWGCDDQVDCDETVPYQNHMSYSDDSCRSHFTEEQVRRMRCTLMHWRPLVFEAQERVDCNPDCPADLDLDGRVDVVDLSLFLSEWGPTDPVGSCADLDQDGMVDGTDLGVLMIQWDDCAR